MLVVEDDQAVLELIRLVLSRVGVRAFLAISAAEAATIAGEAHVDLLVTDVVLSGASGVELAASLREERPALPVLFITGWDEPLELDDMAGDTLVRKPFSADELEKAVVAALEQAAPRSDRYGQRKEETSATPLTARELEVLRYVSLGFQTRAVARHLGVLPGTVTAHLDTIYKKLGVHSRQEAADTAERRGIL